MIELGANLASMVERCEKHELLTGPTVARRALRLLDLTCLEPAADAEMIQALCRRADTPYGRVAAVCVPPRFVAMARECLAECGNPCHLVTVANFPAGEDGVAKAGEGAARAVAEGADEIDLVFPYRLYQAGEHDEALATVIGCRAMCGPDVTLKVIMETGSFRKAGELAEAARDVLAVGADFLKTSTGFYSTGASLSAAAVLLGVIHDGGNRAGLKVSGGIRDLGATARYLALADAIMGPDWASPANFRFGSSALLENLLVAL
ncbi:MAG: deoxyribose-phosphate aldolase [Rhodospirillaceae bacterium]